MDDVLAELEATPPDTWANLAGLQAEMAASHALMAQRWETRRARLRAAGWDCPSYSDMLASLRWIE